MGSGRLSFFIVFMVSLVGMTSSVYLYKTSISENRTGDDKDAVGYISESKNLIEKRPGKRLLWFPVEQGSSVFKGDTIRSSKESSGVIFITESSLKIELEEGSLIQLNFNQTELNLELLQGGLRFMSPVEGVDSKRMLSNIKVGDKVLKVNRGTSDGFVAKSESGALVSLAKGSIDLSGGIKVKAGGGIVINDSGKVLESNVTIKSPQLNRIYMTKKNTKKKIPISWNGDAKAAEFYMGTDPFQMKKINVLDFNNPEIRAFAGTYFLSVKDRKTKEPLSQTIRFSVSEISKPLLVFPSNRNHIYQDSSTNEVDIKFEWLSKDFTNTVLQISKDTEFKNLFKSRDISEKTSTRINFKDLGTFYWRVIGTIDGESVSSNVAEFQVKGLPKPKTPVISSNVPSSIRLWKLLQYGVILAWDGVKSNDLVKFQLKNLNGVTNDFSFKGRSFLNFSEVVQNPGKYSYRLKTVRGKNETEWSSWKILTVLANKTINRIWPLREKQNVYIGDKFNLNWKAVEKQSKFWVVDSRLDGKKIFETKKVDSPLTAFPVAKSGVYEFDVSEFIDKGIRVSGSSRKKYVIAYKTTFPPPFTNIRGDRLTASKDGSFKVRFSQPKFANKYRYVLKKGSRIIKTEVSGKLEFTASNLLPGRYLLEARSFNINEKLGDPYKLLIQVPNQNNLKKPSIKSLKIRRKK